jgi:cystathionine gamma-synthase
VGGLESGQAVAFASGLAAAGAELGRWRVQRIAVDDTAGWIAACATADLVWLESPSNPLLTVADLPSARSSRR